MATSDTCSDIYGVETICADSGSITRPEEFYVGDMVIVTTLSGTKHRGLIRFCGETRFATGTWYGIELDKPDGRNNGSVQGIQYFTCPDRHGIFATASKLKKLVADLNIPHNFWREF